MSHDLPAAVAAASFWMFVAIVVVAGVSSSVFRHRETQKTIRQAIEMGQALTPETLDRLLRSDRPLKGPPSPRLLAAGGIMLLALGGGLGLIGWATAEQAHNPSLIYSGLGVGALLCLLGIGLFVVSLVIRAPRGDGPE